MLSYACSKFCNIHTPLIYHVFLQIGILALNAFVGWYQEKQAGDIVEQLKAGIAMKAVVVRGGKEQEIEARELVPGDIVVVEEGSTIPADGHVRGFLQDNGSK